MATTLLSRPVHGARQCRMTKAQCRKKHEARSTKEIYNQKTTNTSLNRVRNGNRFLSAALLSPRPQRALRFSPSAESVQQSYAFVRHGAPDLQFFRHAIGRPIPADCSTAASGPRPEQQSANFPSITTEGTDRTPRLFARLATFGSFMSSTVTSHDGQAMLWTSLTASLHAGHPALKTSTCRLSVILKTSCRRVASVIDLLPRHTVGEIAFDHRHHVSSSPSRASRIGQSFVLPRPLHALVSFRSAFFIR